MAKAVCILGMVFVHVFEVLSMAQETGAGVAVLENAFILSSNISIVSIPPALARGFGSGMMHGLCTLTVGYGMTFAHTRRKLFYTGSVALLSTAVMYHSLYNILVQSDYQIAGLILPTLTFIPIVPMLRKKNVI